MADLISVSAKIANKMMCSNEIIPPPIVGYELDPQILVSASQIW